MTNSLAEGILKEARTAPIAEALGKVPTDGLIQALMALFEEPERTQETMLLEMVDRCKDTDFGREHGFAEIKSIADFRRRVPISKYEDYRDYIEKIKKGGEDVLTEGRPDYMVLTAGTTGDFKYLPESHENFRSKQNQFRARFRRWQELGLFGRGTVSLSLSSNTPVMLKTECGLECGSASGMSYRMMDSGIFGDEGMTGSAYPACARGCGDSTAVDYAVMRFALEERNVTSAGGNNGGRLRLLLNTADSYSAEIIEDIEKGTISDKFNIEPAARAAMEAAAKPAPERAAELREALAKGGGHFKPKYVWPNFKGMIVWISGLMAAHIEDIIPDLAENSVFMDPGYGASEIDFNFPMEAGDPFGPLCIHQAFFEFLPLGGGEPLLAHEVGDGQYRLVMTTYSGLYRYDLQDIVEVRGRTGATPNICFVSKGKDILNLFGEHIMGPHLAEIMHKTAASMGHPLRQTGVWADLDAHRYICCVEPQSGDFPLEEFERVIDGEFCKYDAAYQFVRGEMAVLALPAKVVQMKQGWQSELYRRKVRPGVSEANIKLQIVMKDAPEGEWMVR